MKRSCLCLAGAAALVLTRPFVVSAQEAQPSPSASTSPSPSPTEEAMPNLGGKDGILNYQEAAGVRITAAWQAKSAEAMVPEPGPDGAVLFRYGQCMPQVVGGLFQQTDIEFQPGESFTRETDLHIGDNVRWVVETSVSGEGDSRTQHIFVQPRINGIYTTLDVTTSRRTYRIFLLSDSKRF